MSPERLLGEEYDYTSDIWSVGILLLHLWCKRYPFEHSCSSPIDLLSELENLNMVNFVRRLLPYNMALCVLSMLALHPRDRPTCAELAESSWLCDCGINNLMVAVEVGRGLSLWLM